MIQNQLSTVKTYRIEKESQHNKATVKNDKDKSVEDREKPLEEWQVRVGAGTDELEDNFKVEFFQVDQ